MFIYPELDDPCVRWENIDNKHCYFYKKNQHTWEEVSNEKHFAWLDFVSKKNESVYLFAKDRDFYIRLAPGQATWGQTLSQATQYEICKGDWV